MIIQSNTQPMFAWHGSPLHIPLSEENAAAYNRRLAQFFDAQKRFKEEHGRPWNEREPLMMEVDEEATRVYNKVADIINACVELCDEGIAFSEEEMSFEDGFKRIN